MDKPDESFSREYRIKSPLDFEHAFKAGVVVADGDLVIHAVPNQLPHPRLGLSISKKFGSAPKRNRWKRWVREVFRREKHAFPHYDLVIRPKRGAASDYAAILKSLPKLVARIEKRMRSNP